MKTFKKLDAFFAAYYHTFHGVHKGDEPRGSLSNRGTICSKLTIEHSADPLPTAPTADLTEPKEMTTMKTFKKLDAFFAAYYHTFH